MVLRFGLTNHTSFRDPVELSFVSSAQADEPAWRMAARDAAHGVLPVLGVWGANAAGKSNLLRAMSAFRRFVKDSFTSLEPNAPLPWTPFAMRKGDGDPPTQMDIDIVVGGERYHFGARFTARGVVEEWLYAWPKHRRQVLFHRDHSSRPSGTDHADPEVWHFGPNLGGQRQVIARATRANSLFLSAAAQHNHERLLPVYQAIVDAIVAERRIELHGYPFFNEDSPILDPALRPVVTKFLAAADIGVIGFRVEEIAAPMDKLAELARVLQPEALREMSEAVIRSRTIFKLYLRHGANEANSWELGPEMESRGTHTLLRRLEDLLWVLRRGGVLVLDEIDTSLHPDLCGTLIDLFTRKSVNPHGAQLVFSTHQERLLSHLRRDEIVLVDKSREGVSTIRTAASYPDLRARDDVARAYSEGRIRGVPSIGNLERITAEGLHRGS